VGTTNPRSGKPIAGEALKQLAYLAAALKAPRITEAAAQLADHARDAGWTMRRSTSPRSSNARSRPATHPGPNSGHEAGPETIASQVHVLIRRDDLRNT
jgi:hypothetical protein